jgi:hypothetical protein
VAIISLNTTPPGATVYDASGKKLGTTPTKIEYPRDGKPHKVTLRHPKAKTRKKTLVASGDTEVNVELEAKSSSRRHHTSRRRSRPKVKKSAKKDNKKPPKPKAKPNDDMMKPIFD